MAVDTRYVTHSKWTSLSVTELTYPNGRQVTSGYDALYRRNTVNETSGGASIAAWQFFGNRTATVALGNGITCSFMNNAQTNSAVQSGVPLPAWGDKTTDRLGYDGSARMIAKRCLPSGSTTSLVGFTTAYDPSSNKQFERALQGDESRSALYPAYDSMDRLLQYQRGILASGGGSVTTPITLPGTDNNRIYNLDGLGNWKNTVFTPEGGSPTTEIRQHNKLNEITQFATTPVTYDHGNNAGNSNPLIAQRGNGNIANDGTRIYAYDALNRLTTVKRKSDNAQVAAYTYDALGRRVLKTVTNGGVPTGIANVTYRYLYDGQQIVEELLVTSGPTYATLRQFVWGQYIDELIQLNVPSNNTTPPLTAGFYYPLQDLLYRTTATTDSSGVIQEAYDFDAYGNTLMYDGPGTDGLWFTNDDVATLQPMCEFLFTGRQYDPETDLYFYRTRYYCNKLGRFLARDRAVYWDGCNLYQYCASSPNRFLDPLGLESYEQCFRACMGSLIPDLEAAIKRYETLDKEGKVTAQDTANLTALQGKWGAKRDECEDKCKDKPNNCFALVCDQAQTFADASLQCVDDTLVQGRKIDQQVLVIRNALSARGCKFSPNSCDGTKGCVKIWLVKYGNPQNIALLKKKFNPKNDPETNTRIDDLLQRVKDCFFAFHAARIDCTDKKCHHIPGVGQDEVTVDRFDDVRLAGGQGKFPEDAAEYWQCECK